MTCRKPTRGVPPRPFDGHWDNWASSLSRTSASWAGPLPSLQHTESGSLCKKAVPCKRNGSVFGARVPLHRALPSVFWAKALHGVLSCVFAESHIAKLRTEAVKHLGHQLAGSNPMLRLSLSQPPTADPGFDQLRTAIFDFQRLCLKSPDLIVHWRVFMRRYDGTLRDGPFTKLLTLLNSIGWQVLVPPMLQDHDGFCFNLLETSQGALRQLLHEAWLQHVAGTVRHKTMTGVDGIDVALTLHTHEKLTAIDLARVKALQSGAFVSSWQHAKYDKTKQPICQHCLQPGTQQHWLKCPRFAAQRSDCGAKRHNVLLFTYWFEDHRMWCH